MTPPTICLNMVVGNEEKVIRRCLESVVEHIDCWAINCNGSDRSSEIVQEVLGHLPGQLLQDPWQNFAQNRSLVINAAKGSANYHFCIDADEVLDINGRLSDHITAHADVISYWVYFSENWAFARPGILSDKLDWRFESVVHNYPAADGIKTRLTLDGVKAWHHKDGFRWDNVREKYAKNAEILERELAGDPGHLRNRYQFYLGESYRDCGEKDKAIEAYRGRIALGGWEEEVYWSCYQIAKLTGATDDYLAAFEFRPSRAEALFDLAERYRNKGQHNTAYMLYRRIVTDPNGDLLFVDRTIYDWRLWDALAVAGYYAGERHELLREFCMRALENAPSGHQARIRENLKYY